MEFESQEGQAIPRSLLRLLFLFLYSYSAACCGVVDWDEKKAAANLAKHDVSFEEAKTVFDDSLYVDFYDPDHSSDEHRYLIIGESLHGHLLLVSYTERNDAIRIISAREVTRAEREAYEEG